MYISSRAKKAYSKDKWNWREQRTKKTIRLFLGQRWYQALQEEGVNPDFSALFVSFTYVQQQTSKAYQ